MDAKTKDRSVEVEAKVRIEEKRIADLLITALDGGSNYWADLYGSLEDIMNGGTVSVVDAETGESLGIVCYQSIATALQLMAKGEDRNGKKIPIRHWQAIVEENDDAETADVFFQMAVMGEIVFG